MIKRLVKTGDWLIKVSLMSNRKIIARKETGRGTQERTLL
jgi:hypothetical protein